MTDLIFILTPIALLDSVSITPLSSIPLLAVLGSQRPLRNALALISGVMIPYLIFGALLLYGLEGIIDLLNTRLDTWIHRPDTLDILLQIIIGMVMLLFGFKLGASREPTDERGASGDIGIAQSFSVGFVLTFVGLPGSLPYFAAIDQMLRADAGTGPTLIALLYYNFLCSAPLLAIMVTRLMLGERSDEFFRRLADFLGHWSHRLIVFSLVLLGAVLVIDGSAWMLGHPLIVI
jgi:cytochrome c biogenesis protein CcdA